MSDPEPLFRAVTPNGRWAVSIEVERATDPDDIAGEWFTGEVTLDGHHVTESMTTNNQTTLLRWAHKQMAAVMKRGEV